jgi:hypothetical protein
MPRLTLKQLYKDLKKVTGKSSRFGGYLDADIEKQQRTKAIERERRNEEQRQKDILERNQPGYPQVHRKTFKQRMAEKNEKEQREKEKQIKLEEINKRKNCPMIADSYINNIIKSCSNKKDYYTLIKEYHPDKYLIKNPGCKKDIADSISKYINKRWETVCPPNKHTSLTP